MNVLGFYPVIDGQIVEDAICIDCVRSNQIDVPQEWEPIFHDMEADTPTHCSMCEALIPHTLTTDGMEYVREAILSGGRPEILAQWIMEYIPEHNAS